MSPIIAKILEEIEKGNIEVESGDNGHFAYPLGLPYCSYLADGELTGFDWRYDVPILYH